MITVMLITRYIILPTIIITIMLILSKVMKLNIPTIANPRAYSPINSSPTHQNNQIQVKQMIQKDLKMNN
jgi:hypothetical protein